MTYEAAVIHTYTHKYNGCQYYSGENRGNCMVMHAKIPAAALAFPPDVPTPPQDTGMRRRGRAGIRARSGFSTTAGAKCQVFHIDGIISSRRPEQSPLFRNFVSTGVSPPPAAIGY
jgi:hypothetical protein